jgi:16S rRNA (guanine527-N7)-methyltransferase
MAAGGVAIFPKGTQADKELEDAATQWQFQAEKTQSKTDPASRILTLKSIQHA